MKVSAIIVTHNRLKMLMQLIDALEKQTRKPDLIIVVNNGSSDGTAEFLNAKPDLIVAHEQNIGASGGFNKGIEIAQKHRATHFWLMDDDGIPFEDSLEKLLSHIKDQEKVVGSICVNPANGNELSFKYRHPTFSSPITELSVLTKTFDSVVPNWACFFNSILIPEKVVQRVGRPNPKLFLWGDEVEYFHRILDSGIKIETLLAAKHSHPLDRLPVVTYRGMHVYSGDMNWKAYCFYRNRGFIHKKFYKYFGLKNIAIEILFQFRNKNFFRALRDSLFITKAHLHGIFRYLDKKLPF